MDRSSATKTVDSGQIKDFKNWSHSFSASEISGKLKAPPCVVDMLQIVAKTEKSLLSPDLGNLAIINVAAIAKMFEN